MKIRSNNEKSKQNLKAIREYFILASGLLFLGFGNLNAYANIAEEYHRNREESDKQSLRYQECPKVAQQFAYEKNKQTGLPSTFDSIAGYYLILVTEDKRVFGWNNQKCILFGKDFWDDLGVLDQDTRTGQGDQLIRYQIEENGRLFCRYLQGGVSFHDQRKCSTLN